MFGLAIALFLTWLGWLLLSNALALRPGELSRSAGRSFVILVAGAMLVAGVLVVLLRDTRLIPAVVAVRLGSRMVMFTVSVRRPIAIVRVGEPVTIGSERAEHTHRTLLLGDVRQVYYTWTIQVGETRVLWTMDDPIRGSLQREWMRALTNAGLSTG